MATNQVHSNFEPMGADAQTLQNICDQQNQHMQQLGSTLENLNVALQGGAGGAFQSLGEQLKSEGTQIATMFQEHSQLMHQNVTTFEQQEADNTNIINSVAAMH
jgi:uncharacterized protein YukE